VHEIDATVGQPNVVKDIVRLGRGHVAADGRLDPIHQTCGQHADAKERAYEEHPVGNQGGEKVTIAVASLLEGSLECLLKSGERIA